MERGIKGITRLLLSHGRDICLFSSSFPFFLCCQPLILNLSHVRVLVLLFYSSACQISGSRCQTRVTDGKKNLLVWEIQYHFLLIQTHSDFNYEFKRRKMQHICSLNVSGELPTGSLTQFPELKVQGNKGLINY